MERFVNTGVQRYAFIPLFTDEGHLPEKNVKMMPKTQVLLEATKCDNWVLIGQNLYKWLGMRLPASACSEA